MGAKFCDALSGKVLSSPSVMAAVLSGAFAEVSLLHRRRDERSCFCRDAETG